MSDPWWAPGASDPWRDALWTIDVRTVAGSLQVLQVNAVSCSLEAVKRKIQEAFDVPVEFQKLLLPSGEILDDEFGQMPIIKKECTTEVTLVVSLDDWCRRVFSNSARTNVTLIRNPKLWSYLKGFGKSHCCKGNDQVITALIHLLDGTNFTKNTILETLKHIAEKGDERVVAASMTLLEDELRQAAALLHLDIEPLTDVVENALDVVSYFARQGDRRTITALAAISERCCNGTRPYHWVVWHAALKALRLLDSTRRIASNGHPYTMAEFVEYYWSMAEWNAAQEEEVDL